RQRGLTALQHAIVRDNDLPIIELLLDHGADFASRHPELPVTSMGLVARRGRSDILELARQRGIPIELSGVEALLAACALSDVNAIQHLSRSNPQIVQQLVADGGRILAEFAGNDNASGVRHLLALGVPVDARFHEGDGYWDVAPESTALHAAAWRAAHDTARLLIEHGADVNAKDGKRRAPLLLAVKACVDSYWTEWRRPDTVAALLAAGANAEGIPDVTGYDEVDALIKAHRAGGR
ncbi:MAG TPA: ankyrin repeat domain-containing protein, partial [Gemmatimonadaceae bacterium]|nr:ankyrin repeat domain-containing protein [Gemmatimonadaceae bacterium]